MNNFLADTLKGLRASPKYLLSKYFYDEAGDAIFQEIMECPEYYLTRCELEICSLQASAIAAAFNRLPEFDLVELGPGDCTKSIYLLDALRANNTEFAYYPIDISSNVISLLEQRLPSEVPGLSVRGLNGDYFAMLDRLSGISSRNKIVLFLGSNIGNLPLAETIGFFRTLRKYMRGGDMLLAGFDLIKDPDVILAAYNDAGGVTRRFNLNLLSRINRELGADFNIERFYHQPVYDASTGACMSFLESKCEQQVTIGEADPIRFGSGERIFMEVSQKYTVTQTDGFAAASGFVPVRHFFDTRHWFLDALWRCED